MTSIPDDIAAFVAATAVGAAAWSKLISDLGPLAQPPKPGPFAGTWAKPLAANTPLAADQTPVAALLAQIKSPYDSVGVNNTSYGVSMFTAPAGQPLVPLKVTAGKADFTPSTGTSAPIPIDLKVPPGGDGSVSVYQPSTDRLWELWQDVENTTADTIAGSWGGSIQGCSTSVTGCFVPGPQGQQYGVAASGTPFWPTVVTFADIQSGAIKHVISLAVESGAAGFRFPAIRNTDSNTAGGIQYGTWFRLPAGLAMSAGLTPWGQMVFTCLQDYGMVVTDKSGAMMIGAQLSADWAGSGTDPITASWAGQPEYNADAGIPWGSLQVVQKTAW